MLLKFIRKHTKLLFISILSLMLIPFLFWGIASKQTGERERPVRTLGRNISLHELKEAGLDSQILLLMDFVEGYSIKSAEQFEMYKDWFNQMMNQIDLDKITLQQLVLRDEAKRYGISISRDELTNWIEGFPLFQRNGVFDIDRYNNIITNYFRTWPNRFEKGANNALAAKKLQRFIMDSVLVSQKEVYEAYKERNEKVSVYYVEFNPQDYLKDTGEIEESELNGYYNSHKEEFREPEKIKIIYLLFDPAAYKDQVTVSQKEIEDYYKEKKYEKTIEEVKEEITEALTKQKTEELCQGKALEVSIELTREKRLGDMIKLANEKGLTLKETEYLSKEQGFIPELGWAPQFIQAAWQMELETVSDLLHVGDKWVIISPKERRESMIPEFIEVKERVKDILKNMRAQEFAEKATNEAYEKLPKGMPFTMAVKSLGLSPKKTKPITKSADLFSLEKRIVKKSTIVSPRKFYPIDNEKWESEREGFTKSYLEEKKRRFFQTWLNNVTK